MEEVHGVDVSWLHHPNKGNNVARKPIPPPTSREVKLSDHAPQAPPKPASEHHKHHSPAIVTPPAVAKPARDMTIALPSTPSPADNATAKSQQKRPNILSRSASGAGEGKAGSRRASWMTNISSKFSSSQVPGEKGVQAPPPPPKAQNGTPATSNSGSPAVMAAHQEEAEEPEAYTPPKPKDGGSFFSSLTRRLSSGSTAGGPNRVQGTGGMCARRVLNVDPNRPRCLVPEMDPNKLRRVSFCVDVEIAGGPRYQEDGDDGERKQKKREAKLKEGAEGDALKRPQAVQEEVDAIGEQKMEAQSRGVAIPRPVAKENQNPADDDASPGASPPIGSLEDDGETSSRKKEKKKKSEQERKERQEKRRRRAEENGTVPVELKYADDEVDASAGSASTPETRDTLDTAPPVGSMPSAPAPAPDATQKQGRPTTDPVRIYRRCCQLRETPILKRITEQLMSPNCMTPLEPGIVNCLDLTGSRLQLADVATLGDWLAVVPVKNLRLEDADLNDEGVRCILAGLLAAKRPAPSKRKSVTPRHRDPVRPEVHRERTGVAEKITLKNNPRITRAGWKHISLFIYMCQSLKAIDLSMNQFPDTLPLSSRSQANKSGAQTDGGSHTREADAAEILYKCISERLGGSRLEELIVSECGLDAQQIRKIVDGAMMCGISRIGLAGNHLDETGLKYVMRYLRSGVCHGLDIGGNDLSGKLGMLAEAMNSKNRIPCWGLSLAGCNLNTEDLRVLFPALAKLPDFRFVDLSHNRDLCTRDNGTISLFRRYMGQMKDLKRVHLADVGMSPKQAIALADCLPDGPRLAHLNILENPQLSALASAKDEESQEEACALYASLMAAVRVSSTLICIDIDVPSPDNSEVVKALAKQVVAYSLRNMEQFAIAEATGLGIGTDLTGALGGEKEVKEIAVPDVLMHLVGHVDGVTENHDLDDPAPDDDYIVGGTGVVRALQYVLGEKANDLRRNSNPTTPVSGIMTPRDRPGSSAGFDTPEQRGKAKKMSTNLLASARKIRTRLQPALAMEATAGDEMAYRRLMFLDNTLQSMIQRFEQEYPETRIAQAPVEGQAQQAQQTLTGGWSTSVPPLSLVTSTTNLTTHSISDDEDDDVIVRPPVRHGSEVSLAARALSLEEGRLHRLGQHLRRDIIDSPTMASAPESDKARIAALGARLEAISGDDLKNIVESDGWASVLQSLGANHDDLRSLQEQDPVGWEQFKESQMKARMNLDRERPGSAGLLR